MKRSAGLLLYRYNKGTVEVLLVHPGGPFWARKDSHGWSVPKGEFEPPESALAAARREFVEETGFAPEGEPRELGVTRAIGKEIHAWALEANWDPAMLRSNSFSMEFPPRSGRMMRFPEVDRAAWFPLATAKEKIHEGQAAILAALESALKKRSDR